MAFLHLPKCVQMASKHAKISGEGGELLYYSLQMGESVGTDISKVPELWGFKISFWSVIKPNSSFAMTLKSNFM